MKVAMVAVLVGFVMIANVVPASADEWVVDTSREDYHAAMWYFVPTIGKWSNELQGAIDTALVKPEQACKVMPELEYRGTGMIEDLEGTTPPSEIAEVHASLISSLRVLTAAAGTACTDPATAQPIAGAELQNLNDARHTMLAWVLADVQPIRISVEPATGN